MSPFFGKSSHFSFFSEIPNLILWFIFSFLEFYLAIDSSREKSQLESNADNSACDAKKVTGWRMCYFLPLDFNYVYFFYKANEFLNKCNRYHLSVSSI